VPPGTPFPPGFTDLRSWARDQFLGPDWLRIGTDIVGQGAFNAAFVLNGVTVPSPVAGAGLPALVVACGCLSPWRVGGAAQGAHRPQCRPGAGAFAGTAGADDCGQ
jgi:hypothetical protein